MARRRMSGKVYRKSGRRRKYNYAKNGRFVTELVILMITGTAWLTYMIFKYTIVGIIEVIKLIASLMGGRK